MKGLKTGYVLAMVSLFTMTGILGVAAFYPAPKGADYPTQPRYPTADYDSGQYQQEQQRYERELRLYDDTRKEIESKRQIWSQTVMIICLVMGIGLLMAGMVLYNWAPLLAVSMVFAAFIMVVFGPGAASVYGSDGFYSLISGTAKVDLSGYRQVQFFLVLIGSVLGVVFGFIGPLRPAPKTDQS